VSEELIPFFTGDQHFDHHSEKTGKGILLYQKDTRPFKTIEEMNDAWIDAWNKKVPEKGAIVRNLGDIVFGGINRLKEILERLHFDVLEIIPGNHDTWAKPNKGRYEIPLDSGRLVVVRPLYHQIKIEDQRVVLCHFPMRSWNASYHGSWHLYGHVHRYIEPWGMSMDVGGDGAEGIPYSWPEICEWMEQRALELKAMRKVKKNAERL
jgi:calcineurin-like phosphoesterase family protein